MDQFSIRLLLHRQSLWVVDGAFPPIRFRLGCSIRISGIIKELRWRGFEGRVIAQPCWKMGMLVTTKPDFLPFKWL